AAGRGASASSSAASAGRVTWASFGHWGHRDLDLLAPGHVLLGDVLIAPRDLVAQQPVVENVRLGGARRRFAKHHHEPGHQRRSSYDAQLALRARAEARALEPQRADERAARIKECEPHRTPALRRNLGFGEELIAREARDRGERVHTAMTDPNRLRRRSGVLTQARVDHD